MSGADRDTLDGLLTAAAVAHPDRPAVIDGNQLVSYAELEHRVTTFADRLVAAGVSPGARVGVFLPRSLDAVIAGYAVLLAGAVAAPLDVTDPPGRTASLVHGAGLGFVLSAPNSGLAATATSELGPNLTLATTGQRGTGCDDEGGYLLFTSGSTGTPKGVLLSHANVLHFVRWAVREFGVTPDDRIGSQAAFTFDLSTFDIFGSALAGAGLCLMPEWAKAFPRDAVRWLDEQRVSIFYAVPTLYGALLDRGGIAVDQPRSLRVIAFAGEPFPPRQLRRYLDAFGMAEFYNLYGPTETNVCTAERLPREWSADDGLAIGTPIEGTHVTLVDSEIAVAGPSVCRGYLVNGELLDPAVPVRFGDGVTRRAYLTGDLARYGAAGTLHLRGRRDHQIKRRGHRIELPGIEAVAQAVPGVRASAAIWRPGGDGEIRLFVTGDADRDELTRALTAVLPRGALPDRVEFVDELPVNGRGKIDRDALASRRVTERGVQA